MVAFQREQERCDALERPVTGAEQPARVGFDLLVLRPLSVVTTAVSLVGAAIAYPVALPFGWQDHVVEYLVESPVDRTFRRP